MAPRYKRRPWIRLDESIHLWRIVSELLNYVWERITLKVPLFVDIWVTLAGVRLRVLVVASLEPEDVEPLRLHRKDSTEQEIVSLSLT